MEAAGAEALLPSPPLPGSSFPQPTFPERSCCDPRESAGWEQMSPPGTCPLKELGHFGRIFLPCTHFPFLPSTLSLTQISPSPRWRSRSHVVPIFLQENPLNPSRQLQVRSVPEHIPWVGQQAHPHRLAPPGSSISHGSGQHLPSFPAPGGGWPSSLDTSLGRTTRILHHKSGSQCIATPDPTYKLGETGFPLISNLSRFKSQ